MARTNTARKLQSIQTPGAPVWDSLPEPPPALKELRGAVDDLENKIAVLEAERRQSDEEILASLRRIDGLEETKNGLIEQLSQVPEAERRDLREQIDLTRSRIMAEDRGRSEAADMANSCQAGIDKLDAEINQLSAKQQNLTRTYKQQISAHIDAELAPAITSGLMRVMAGRQLAGLGFDLARFIKERVDVRTSGRLAQELGAEILRKCK